MSPEPGGPPGTSWDQDAANTFLDLQLQQDERLIRTSSPPSRSAPRSQPWAEEPAGPTASWTLTCGDEQAALGVQDPLAQRLGREACKLSTAPGCERDLQHDPVGVRWRPRPQLPRWSGRLRCARTPAWPPPAPPPWACRWTLCRLSSLLHANAVKQSGYRRGGCSGRRADGRGTDPDS